MQDGVTAPVIGPSAILPRGYLWTAPIWYLVVAALLVVSPWPIWFRATSVIGLFLAVIIFVLVVNSITTHSFSADPDGVRLGLPSSSRRRGRRRRGYRYLPWSQIERVRLAPRAYGTRVELVLGPNASLALRGYRLNPARRAFRWLLLLIPFWYLRRPTALISPLEGPPRYRVQLRGIYVDELRMRMRAVAPPEVAVAVLIQTG